MIFYTIQTYNQGTLRLCHFNSYEGGGDPYRLKTKAQLWGYSISEAEAGFIQSYKQVTLGMYHLNS